MLSAKISRSITEIDRAAWESAFPPVPEGYGYLKTSEETLSGQFKFYYISVYKASRLISVAPCFIFDYPLETTLDGKIRDMISGIRKAWPRFFMTRVVACGSPTCEGRLKVSEPSSGDAAIRLVVNEMKKIAAKEQASIVAFKEFSGEYSKLLKGLSDMRFHSVPTLPSVELNIIFRSFDEYLASLSDGTRADLKRKFKKTDGKVDIRMEVRTSLGDLLDDVYSLYLANLDKSDMQFEIITKDFFAKISDNMPENVKYFLWFVNGKLAAFSQDIVSGDVIVAEYIGFDYRIAYDYHLYFIVLRDKIKWCIRNNIRKYETGALGYDPKKRLDFGFVPQYIHLRHMNFIGNIFFGLLANILKPENYDPILKNIKRA